MTLYVKKIWSTGPKEYKYVKLDLALKLYDIYLNYYRHVNKAGEGKSIKSFEKWLSTEI